MQKQQKGPEKPHGASCIAISQLRACLDTRLARSCLTHITDALFSPLT